MASENGELILTVLTDEKSENNYTNQTNSEVITIDNEIKSVTSEYKDAIEEVKPIEDEKKSTINKYLTLNSELKANNTVPEELQKEFVVEYRKENVPVVKPMPVGDILMNTDAESAIIIIEEIQIQEKSTPILSESELITNDQEKTNPDVTEPISNALESIYVQESIKDKVVELSNNNVRVENTAPTVTESSSDVKDVLEVLQANLGITDIKPDDEIKNHNRDSISQMDENVVFLETTNETINMESTNEEEEEKEIKKEPINGHSEEDEKNLNANEAGSTGNGSTTINAIEAVVKNENIPVVVPNSTPKTPNKKKKTSTPKNVTNDAHASQKRRKKDPAAPKAPLNGYLVYFNDERADMRMKNPNMGFGELTKIIAIKWKDLPMDEKQRFITEADHDKERYVREMVEYKKSDSYKNYVKETSQAKLARNDEMLNNSLQNDPMNSMSTPNSFSIANETNIAGFDIPIFTEEFIEHSKSRENEMRLVRKEITELEQQNSVLHKHIEIMKQSSVKLDNDIERYQTTNNQIKQKMDAFRQTIINCNIQIPNTMEFPTPNNIDDYIMRLYSIVANSNPNSGNQNDAAFTNHVKTALSKINFNTLFE